MYRSVRPRAILVATLTSRSIWAVMGSTQYHRSNEALFSQTRSSVRWWRHERCKWSGITVLLVMGSVLL